VFDQVVVGATDEDGATRAVTRAIEVARLSGGTVHVVAGLRRRRHLAVTEDRRRAERGLDPDEAVLRRLEAMAARQSVPIRIHPLRSEPAEAITAVAAEQGADLIVVGTGPERRSRHLSDVSKAVMDRADCAVMLV
jgi:nucleotide-binding universal stress UspA family protein